MNPSFRPFLTKAASYKQTLLWYHFCHTRFYNEIQMHLICGSGSSLHTYDRCHEHNHNISFKKRTKV
jgi:hypothetical protein